MSESIYLSLHPDASLVRVNDDEWLVEDPQKQVTLTQISPGTLAALKQLATSGKESDDLLSLVRDVDEGKDIGNWIECLRRLDEHGFLLRSVHWNSAILATLEPTARPFDLRPHHFDCEKRFVLSRFAYVHRERTGIVLESPLVSARVLLHDSRVATIVHALGQPVRGREIHEQLVAFSSDLSFELVRDVLGLLFFARLVDEIDEIETSEKSSALQTWEFHDLLFHARSRAGRHDQPVGATFRFANLVPPPALKPSMEGQTIDLYRPDLDRLISDDMPFSRVLEVRRSIRDYGKTPISLKQLGEFLYRVGRVADYREERIHTSRGQVQMQFALRPYPGGGALHELELYAVINRCQDLGSGLYYFDPLRHQLVRLHERTAEVEQLLAGAAYSASIQSNELQVLIVIAARFQRTAWKYSSMAYSLVLKDVGVLYQTMYLVATAMQFAACGVGYGNSDLFSSAAGTNYYEETSVGEFLLGSRA